MKNSDLETRLLEDITSPLLDRGPTYSDSLSPIDLKVSPFIDASISERLFSCIMRYEQDALEATLGTLYSSLKAEIIHLKDV